MPELPATAYSFDDGSEPLPRRAITVGSWVTGEDPAGPVYGRKVRVVDITQEGRAVLLGYSAQYTRREIRDVRDRPSSAQIGWEKTVWETL